MPYAVQCAIAVFRAIPEGDPLARALLDEAGSLSNLTLQHINYVTRGLPALVAGCDVANPGLPQTLDNLRKWRERSALGRIYMEALPMVGGSKAPPCVFVRAKGTRRIKSGKYAGRLGRENFVLHEFTGIDRECPDDILLRLDFPGRGLIFVERRITFVKALVRWWASNER